MTDNSLPTFSYHPDPLATGAAEPSSARCDICQQTSGYRYRWTLYCANPPDHVCLRCIQSGRACRSLSTTTHRAVITDLSLQENDFTSDIAAELQERTPGFCSWQRERWLTHCGDAAAFLGSVGYVELCDYPTALADIRRLAPTQGWAAEHVEQWLHELENDGETTAYLFQCRSCHQHLAYWDEAET